MIALHLRRSLGLWLILPLTIVGLFAAQGGLYGASTFLWPLSASAVGNTTHLMGPLVAGAATYAGNRARRQNTLLWERISAIGQGPAALAELAALIFWITVSFLVVLASVYVPTALHATWGHPPVLRTAATLLGLWMITCFAYVLGRVVPYRLTPLAAAIFTYMFISLDANSNRHQFELFSPADLHVYDQFRGPSPSAAVSQIAWYTAAAICVIVLWIWRRSASRWFPIVLAATLLATISSGVAVAAQAGRAYAPAVLDVWNCTGTSPEVCVHPAYSNATQTISTEIQPITQRLTNTPFAVRRIEQRPRGIGSTPTPGAVGFALDDLRPASIRRVGGDIAVNALGLKFETCMKTDGSVRVGYEYAQILSTYVESGSTRDYSSPDPAEQDAAKKFGGLSEMEKQRWLRDHADKLTGCSLTATDFS